MTRHNASQLYDHFPPKHLFYCLQRQQMRQAGNTMRQPLKYMFDLKTRAYVVIPIRDASDTLTRVHGEVEACL